MATTIDLKALKKAYDQASRDLQNYKQQEPKPTWTVQSNLGAIESIQRLIKNSPANSAKRQEYIEQLNAYKRKREYWNNKYKTYNDIATAALRAYQDAAKLEPLLAQQKDNEDIGEVDTKLNAKIDELKSKITESTTKGATASEGIETPGQTKPKPKPKDTDGDGIPDVLDKNPKVFDKPKPGAGAGGNGGNGNGQTPPPADGGADVKDLWVSYLKTTFLSLEDKEQKAEIDLLIKRAKDEKWNEDTFMDALEGTKWWKETYPSLRQFFLDSHDPRKAATFAEKVSNTMNTMLGKLEKLGVTVRQIDPATGQVIDNTDFVKGIALKSIENNWDDDELGQYLATQSSIIFSGGGTLGSFYDRIAQQAYLYGVPLDETMKKQINISLLDPLDGRDANYWIKTVKDMAYDAPENKPFLESLKTGRNLYEVTNSYRQQMANLLEVDSTAITWKDLMGKVVDNTTGNARTFADFTKQLKSDPLWQYTRNAKETYSNTALDIAKMFGFMG